MRYHNISTYDFSNGDGIRVVLWLAHCDHHCKNCHNPETWDVNSGIPFMEEDKEELFSYLRSKFHNGITFSGGDPLSVVNRDEVGGLMKEIKETFPDKDIWIYTGYLWEDVKDLEYIKYADILVDGKYVEELSNPSPRWKGSRNQRIIDVKESLKENKVVISKFSD